MGLSVVRDPFRTMGTVLPELVLSQRRAVANARAAVDRDRRLAALRATVENSAEMGDVLTVLGRDVVA